MWIVYTVIGYFLPLPVGLLVAWLVSFWRAHRTPPLVPWWRGKT